MKLKFLLLVLFLAANASILSGQTQNADRKKNLNASLSGNVDSLISLWDNNGLMLPSKEEPVSGIKAITKYLQNAHSKRVNIDLLEYKHDFKELNIVDTLAYEWGFYKNKIRVKRNGSIITVKGKLFRVLRKNKNGDWKVFRAMWTTDSIDKKW